ncbi:NADP-dependent oxidoreductase [Phytomonospora endophytica]|uniref:Enoyl reductase n=1 Tax=Phytomonospora endophytica TaxID=714109 RepID=A0A841FU38_9ACTN|nr:NADP-dependent oxidoreductase [Phytomonospora endophytica]MBB6038293.1 enoyl reductase [Phytomonospora endophytica]
MPRALVFSEYGGPEVLRLIDVPLPEPGLGEVRLRVRAAGVQPFDNAFRAGMARAWAPASFDRGGGPQPTGTEAAGVVDAVGDGVSRLTVGDEVLGWCGGAFAEYTVVPEGQLAAKPAGMPWAEAGSLTASGQTAHSALRALGAEEGETLLVHAAAGGVGSYAVQLAVAWGMRVIGTASARNHDYLRELGATPVAYGPGLADRVRAIAAVDASFDAVATDESLRVGAELAPGRAGTIAGDPGKAAGFGVRWLDTGRDLPSLQELLALYGDGRLRVEVARTFPLDRAAEAMSEVATGHVRGKVVVTPA